MLLRNHVAGCSIASDILKISSFSCAFMKHETCDRAFFLLMYVFIIYTFLKHTGEYCPLKRSLTSLKMVPIFVFYYSIHAVVISIWNIIETGVHVWYVVLRVIMQFVRVCLKTFILKAQHATNVNSNSFMIDPV